MKFPLPLLLLAIAIYPALAAEDLSLGIAGWEKTQAGDHKGAIELFKRCIEEGNLSNPSLARTYRNLAIALRRDGRPREALEYYDKAIALGPEDVHKDHVSRGNAYSDLREFDQALAEYDQAQKLLPGYDEAFYNRGIVFELLGRNEEAVAQFKLAYEAGCRTNLLYDRFVAHGLIKAEGGGGPAGPPEDRAGRTFCVFGVIGIENFAEHTLTLAVDGNAPRSGRLSNWSKIAEVESGSVSLGGPMPERIEATLEYAGKTYRGSFVRPVEARNSAALYELSWTLQDGSHAWSYAGYQWTWRGLEFEAHFDPTGTITTVSVEQRDETGRVVTRYVPAGDRLVRVFVADIPSGGVIRWIDISSEGTIISVTSPGISGENGVKLAVGPDGKIQSANTRRNTTDDYTVPVEVTPEMAALVPRGDSLRPPEIDWEACLAFARLSLDEAGPPANQGQELSTE